MSSEGTLVRGTRRSSRPMKAHECWIRWFKTIVPMWNGYWSLIGVKSCWCTIVNLLTCKVLHCLILELPRIVFSENVLKERALCCRYVEVLIWSHPREEFSNELSGNWGDHDKTLVSCPCNNGCMQIMDLFKELSGLVRWRETENWEMASCVKNECCCKTGWRARH